MEIKLDFRSHIPIQVQVKEQIRNMLVSGKFEPGERLPTVRELGLELGVNFATIARAYRRLDAEGLLSTQQGRGTYILPGAGSNVVHVTGGERLLSLVREFFLRARRLGFGNEDIHAAVKTVLKVGRE
jgi:GntR family transcriptional regulator